MELQGRRDALARQGLGLAAISYDPVAVLAEFAARRGITFPLLSDVGSVTIRQYGILNTTVAPTNQQAFGIPFPGTFMVNGQRIVTSRFFEPAYQERMTAGSILARVGANDQAPATRLSSPQLEISTYPSDATVAPGTHFSVVLDVRPARGMHLYAPGVTGYQTIAVAIDPARWLSVLDAHYPPSEDYVFKPLNEHVRIYQRRFRIVQDLGLEVSPEAQNALKDVNSLTVTGRLSYQACSDTICFSPQTVPLTWTVRVRQLDRERVKH